MMASMESLQIVAPAALERAQRVDFAIGLLRCRTREAEVRKRVQRVYDCSRATAWRIVDIAKDAA